MRTYLSTSILTRRRKRRLILGLDTRQVSHTLVEVLTSRLHLTRQEIDGCPRTLVLHQAVDNV